jgi:ammonia channel protein AmtB
MIEGSRFAIITPALISGAFTNRVKAYMLFLPAG